MTGIGSTILGFIKKLGYYVMEYAYAASYWILRFFKVQLKSWTKCSAQKRMEKTFGGLGSEIYALHKQGETDWQRMPLVQQQLKVVEESESQVFVVDSAIEEINNEYRSKRDELREKYATKRAEVGKETPEEM